MSPEDRTRANKRVAMIAGGVFVAMLGLSFAAVPLYDLFCKMTGYGGTTQEAVVAPKVVLERTVNVRFDTNVAPGSPLEFGPGAREKTVRLGETALMFFRITNPTNKPVKAVATYNVVPQQAGLYFNKLECFCFQERTFAPGETIELPVVFFVDPEMLDNRDTSDVGEITLSYTYFDAGAAEVKTANVTQAPREIGRVVATP
jgi:cytochrome c oxidase assembly protein subunit 11